MYTFVRSARAWGAVLCLTLAGNAVQASDKAPAASGMRGELAQMARDLKSFLDKQGEKSVAMGQIVGPPQLAASAGPGLAKILTDELRKNNVDIKRRSRLGLKGEFQDVIDNDGTTKRLAVQLRVQVVDRTNKTLVQMDCGILENEDVATLLGATASLSPKAGNKTRNDQLQGQIDNPKAHLAGSRVSAGKDRPFAMEILVDETARPARSDEGQAFVKIDRGEIYTVRLINDADYEVAVKLTIDGINMFAFSEVTNPETGLHKYNYVIVPAKSSLTVTGWHRTDEVSDSFQVTELAKSAAAYLNSTAKVGTITASFHASWAKDADPPADELTGRSGSATGFGPPVEAGFTYMRRSVGVVRDIISVRYTKD
jgi:hypothetical protein